MNEKIVLGLGMAFNVFNVNEINPLILLNITPTGLLVTVDDVKYTIYHGSNHTFQQKIKELLDVYGEKSLADYPVDKED